MNKKSVIGARCYQLQLIYMHKRQMTKVGTTAEEMQALKMDKMPFNGATYDHCGDEATVDQLLCSQISFNHLLILPHPNENINRILQISN